jgi:hypothetical protein
LSGRFNVDRLSDTNPTDIASQNVVQGAGMQFADGASAARSPTGSLIDDGQRTASYQQADPVAQFVPNRHHARAIRPGPVYVG